MDRNQQKEMHINLKIAILSGPIANSFLVSGVNISFIVTGTIIGMTTQYKAMQRVAYQVEKK